MTPERLKEIGEKNKNGEATISDLIEMCSDMFISQSTKFNENKRTLAEINVNLKKVFEAQEKIDKSFTQIINLQPPMVYTIYDETDEPLEDEDNEDPVPKL